MKQRIELTEFKDNTVYPVEASAQGNNAYYLEYCTPSGYRPAYASCLNRIATLSNGGQLLSNEQGCASAIKNCVCPAMAMRKQEIHEGQAIYFYNRTKMRQNARQNALKLGLNLLDEPEGKGELNALTGHAEHASDTYSAALNSHIAKENLKSTSNATETSLSSVNKSVITDCEKGLTLLEIARIARDKKQAATEI